MLKYREFLAWLKSKDPDETIGKASSVCACPIATYLAETRLGIYFVTATTIDRGANRLKTPPWAARFIERVDDTYVDTWVTAREALRCLRERNKV